MDHLPHRLVDFAQSLDAEQAWSITTQLVIGYLVLVGIRLA